MDLTQIKQLKIIHLLAAITFFTSGVLVNLVQCALYLGLRPFNKRLYRQINWYLCATVYLQLVFLGDWWSGSRVKVYIRQDELDKYFGKEHALCVMNHSYDIDWLIGWMLCNRLHLIGNCKAYSKKSIQYIPVLGWAWKCAEFVFLERSFDKDKEIINKQISELADHPDPMWLLLFPEGTRFTPEKHEVSEQFAKEKGLTELKYHLQPRCKGFIASLPSMKRKVPAVYNVCLSFPENDPFEPTMTNFILGKPTTAHIYLDRIPFETLPESEAAQEQFLRDMFLVKDKMRESFKKTGDFFTLSGVSRVEPIEMPPPKNSMINILIWNIAVLCPMMYYLLPMLFSGQLFYVLIGAGIIGGFMFLLYNAIGQTKSSKGSSYGTSKKEH